MMLLYQDPHGKFVTENTITHSVRDTGVKLNNFPSQVPQSGSDAAKQRADIDMSEST